MACRHNLLWQLRFGPAMLRSVLPVLFALGIALPARAADDRTYTDLPEAVARVENETGGKVLQVRPIQRGDREVYRMKVLTPEGRVKIVHDDPKRARLRRDESDDSSKPDREPAHQPEPTRRPTF